MKKRLSDQRNLTRRLGWLFLLYALLLVPIGAWAEDYDLWIGDVQVTTDNWSNIQGSNIKVGYARFIRGANGSNTLELHNIQTYDCIKSELGDLEIILYGHNRIGYIANDEDNPAIYTESGGTLTLTKGTTNASLYVESMQVESVIYGFDSFVYTGFSVEPSENTNYSQQLGLNDGVSGIEIATFYTGNLYPLWVGGTQVSSANQSDIRDDNISAGTLSFDPKTNTLTMTNVVADMASDDNDFVETTIPDLTVKLLGTNEVTLNYEMYQTDNCFARYTGEGAETTPTLTFDTQWGQNAEEEYVFGSLTVKLSSDPSTVIEGISEQSLVAQGYTIGNTFGGDKPCWRISDDLTDQAKVWYDGVLYDLSVANVRVTSANVSNVLGDAIEGIVSFDAATNTLTLDNVDLSAYGRDNYSRRIQYSGTDDLTIALKGDNKLSRIFYYDGEGTPSLSFVKVEDADNCSLELNYVSSTTNEGVITYFKDVDFGSLFTISDGPVAMEQFFNDPNQKSLNYTLRDYNKSVENLVITSATTYPLWVAETQVTEENKANVKEDNTSSVSFAYDADNNENTLTLSNALLNKAIVSGLDNLTIHLSGESRIENTSIIAKGIQSTNPDAILTFTSEVDQASSLPVGYLMFGQHTTTPFDGFASYTYNNGLAYGRNDETRCVGLISYFFIGDNEINSAKLSAVEDIVVFNNQTNTLSLNGVGSAGVIRYNQYEDVTIEFDGDNLTDYIAGTGNGNLYIKKAANAESPSPTLEIVGNYDGLGAISGFKNCTWEDGLYMNSYTYDQYEGYTVLSGVYFDTEDGYFTHPSSSVDQIIFSTEQVEATPSIWIGSTQVDAEGTFVDDEGNTIEGASFAVVDDVNVLTLSGASLDGPIVSSLPNLTVKLFGINYASQIISSDPAAVLTFAMDDEAEEASLSLSTEMTSVISGFADVELTDVYYECSEMSEYDTTTKKFINPIDNYNIISLGISSTETYSLWIAGTQVTADNASNIFDDDYSSASFADNTLTLKAFQNGSTDYDYPIMIGDEMDLNIVFVGYNSLGSIYAKTFIYAKDACTVTFSTDASLPGQMICVAENAFKTDNVTIDAGDLEMEAEGYSTTVKSSSADNIYYFGSQSFMADYWEGDYPSGDYYWYFSNAVTNSDNSGLPPIVSSSEGTTKMKAEGYSVIKSLTFQCLPLSGDAEITVALKNLEDEDIVYATGTLTDGVVSLTPNAAVTYEEVCLVFTSEADFSFVPLAVQTVIKPGIPYFYTNEEETYVSIGFEYEGDEVRYTIDYASEDLQDVEDASWTFEDDVITIDGPCTVTAYVVKDGEESDVVKGKYFSSNPSPFRIVYGADPVDLVLAPAIEEDDGIEISGIEVSVNYDSETGKVSSETMGSLSGPCAMSETEGKTTILNNYFWINFEVVPPAPAVSLEAGSYLPSNDPITITGTGQANTTIMYQWDDGNAEEYAEAIPFHAGTLMAWEMYSDGTSIVVGDTTTVVYTQMTELGITFGESQTWATYYATENLTTPEGLTAYIVSNVDASDGNVTAEAVDYIPMNQAVLLKRGDDAPLTGYVAVPYTGAKTAFTNLLLGSDEEVSVSSITTGSVYVLFNDGFTRATKGSIPARRGYLLLTANAGGNSRLTIVEGTASGISDIEHSILNIEHSVYDLQGRRMESPMSNAQRSSLKKGLYIINGKKTVVK